MEKPTVETTHLNVRRVYALQKANRLAVRMTTAKQRKSKLRRLNEVINARKQDILSALKSDLRKPEFESAVFEIHVVQAEIDFAIDNLSDWLSPHPVSANLVNLTTRNRIIYEPKGVCLIISPWNYPFQLLMSPLVSAIAAGNCCMLKPSELAPATSCVLSTIIREVFNENEVALFEGDAALATSLLSLPFDHIFFTGSTPIGKVVMQAAAQHLTSVTLELGGKSPAIIDQQVNLKKAAEKIAWGKWANAGQTCIAPDYVFVHETQQAAFIALLKASTEKLYFQQGRLNTGDYGKIISPRHFTRLKNLWEDALSKGAKAEMGGVFTDTDSTISPSILTQVDPTSQIMQEEIFGPILPVLTYKDLSETLDYIRSHDKPLALYIFSKRNRVIQSILDQTTSGGTCVNDVLIHLSNPYLPFGGIGSSGTGGSHGFFGFRAFSHERGVMYQNRWFDIGKIVYPPYKGKGIIGKILRRLM